MTTISDIRTDLISVENLLTCFYGPWDANDTRPLWLLKEALDAQQRALVALLNLVESDRAINAAHRGRINSLEHSLR